MTDYKLVTVDDGGEGRAGVLVDGLVYDAEKLTARADFGTVRGILANWQETQAILSDAGRGSAAQGRALADVKLLAALPNPGTIFCTGANYKCHMDAMSKSLGLPPPPSPAESGLPPFIFLKASSCVVGPDGDIPAITEKLDYEAELGVVIGTKLRNATPDEALKGIAGYLAANDMSARDRLTREAVPVGTPFRHDWFSHKNFDGACPLGPYLVPADQIADPQTLTIQTRVNGELRQDATTGGMIYSIADIVAHLSTVMSLLPGDVILTGTPAGVAAETGRFLKVGDIVEVQIGDLGPLRNRIVVEAQRG